MNDKKRMVLEAALRCFSQKGFRATSMQDIADEIGMAKGSLYFYFKSKDELLLSVVGFVIERLMSGMRELPEERHFPPREKLCLQLARHFANFRREREFAALLMREPALGAKSEVRDAFLAFKSRIILWYQQRILEIYGREAEPYSWDGAELLSGMSLHYMSRMLEGGKAFGDRRLARFLVQRLDDVMEGMIRKKERPLLSREDVLSYDGSYSDPEMKFRLAASELRKAAEQAKDGEFPAERKADLFASLSLMEDELAKPVPEPLVLRGMLAYVKELSLPAWADLVERLESSLYLDR
ncbi:MULTISPECIES: TetR/AcrR family transcriptional regulator [Cohnella]|uniref:TetR/AcrR family transcriptional regulator n=1 Tax=Cohnella TaxID=329857 RepID=UPI000363FABA|nr:MULTISPECIES: TetR/AcrR family transcriptional regulator [Cohnella]REK68284.1 MAG: TetR family transcriptional regulator [Cohnella sp.]